MTEGKLSGEALCRGMMWDLHMAIDDVSRRLTGYLRQGIATPSDQYGARHIGRLAPAHLSREQIDALEETLRQAQEELIHVLFCTIDGGRQPHGFPDEIRLVDMDTGEPICPGFLAPNFSIVGVEWRDRSREGSEGTQDGG